MGDTRAGDVINFRGDPSIIKAATLYRVHPTDRNRRVVTPEARLAGGARPRLVVTPTVLAERPWLLAHL